MSEKVEVEGYEFVKDSVKNQILVFKGDALADVHHCKNLRELDLFWGQVKKAKTVITK